MLNLKIPRSVLAAIVLALAAPLSGCTLEAEAPVAEYGYEPVYYDGYMVYYDTAGAPYYYIDGTVYYVPRTYVYYDSLVDHYRVYRPYYHRWYVSGGYRYKHYHSAAPPRVVSAPPRTYRPASPHPHPHHRAAPRSAPRRVPHSAPHHSGGRGHRR